jgi:hypothetical protein
MAHCARILAPSCAWSESTEPKKRSRSIASRLGNAIRAMKPLAKRFEEEPVTEVFVLNAAAVKDHEDCSLEKETMSYDEISTQSGGSRRSSFSLASQSSSACLTESVEEMMLPGTPEEISPSSSQSCKSENSGSIQGSELQALARIIADHAQSKFSGRVYQDVRNAFLAVDTNGDGKLTPTEALAFCQHFNLSPATTSRFFALLDHSETGLADWSSFLAQTASVFMKKTDLKLNPGMGRKWPAIQ